MPSAIVAAIASVVVSVGASTPLVAVIGIGGLQLAGTVIGGLAIAAAGVAASTFLAKQQASQSSNVFSSATPAPSDGQQTVRQSTASRWKHYGRVKIGGAVFFYESRDGFFHVGMAQGRGPIDAIEEHWLNDTIVTLDGSDMVQESTYIHSGTSRVQITSQLGEDDQVAHPTLRANFDTEWTVDHRLRGEATVVVVYQDVPSSAFSSVYKGGAPTYRSVIRGSKVLDTRTNTTAWSDNAALCILDYLLSDDGLKRSISQIDTDAFNTAADVCDELVTLNAGGTEKRYRLWGSYKLDEEPRNVLPRMLAACDGWLFQKADGKISLIVGKWVAPTVTIDDSLGHIVAAQVSQGNDTLSASNVIKFVYASPDHDYQETDGDPWRDDTSITELGEELEDTLELYMVPSHTQARRLAKIAYNRRNPRWLGTIRTNLFGLQAIGERVITVKIAELEIDETFAVTSLRLLDDGTGCEIGIASLASSAFDWDETTEEGTAPVVPPDTSGNFVFGPPDNVNLHAGQDGSGTFILVTWNPLARTSYSAQVQYRKEGTSDFTLISTQPGETSIKTVALDAGSTYEVQARTVSSGGSLSDWSTLDTVVATANVTAPGSVTGLTATATGSTIQVAWTLPASSNVVGARVYRGATFGGATLLATIYDDPSASQTYDDEDLAAGTYDYWVTAINASEVASSEAGPASDTVV